MQNHFDNNKNCNTTQYERYDVIMHQYNGRYVDFVFKGQLISRMVLIPVTDAVIIADFITKHKAYLHRVYNI